MEQRAKDKPTDIVHAYVLAFLITFGYQDTALMLLRGTVNPNASINEYGDKPLTLAVYYRQANVVKGLVEAKADLDDASRLLPLSAQHDDFETTTYLVSQGIDVNVTDHDGRSALSYVAKTKRHDVLKTLLSAKVKPDFRGNYHYESALPGAIRAGYLENVRFLLSAGAELHPGPSGMRVTPGSREFYRYHPELPLTIAAKEGVVEIIALLLAQKAEIGRFGLYGTTALISAVVANQVQSVRTLIGSNADVNQQDYSKEKSPLLSGCKYSADISILNMLLEAKADPNANAGESDTPLTIVAEKGNLQAVTALIDAKADLNLSAHYRTPLTAAVGWGTLSCVTILIQRGARVNQVDKWGMYPLHKAVDAYEPALAIVQILLDAKATVNHAPSGKPSLLSRAAGINSIWYVDRLLEAKASVESEGLGPECALAVALRQGNTAVAERLVLETAKVLQTKPAPM